MYENETDLCAGSLTLGKECHKVSYHDSLAWGLLIRRLRRAVLGGALLHVVGLGTALAQEVDRQEPQAIAKVLGYIVHCDPIVSARSFLSTRGMAITQPGQQVSANMWVATDSHTINGSFYEGGDNHEWEWIEVLFSAYCGAGSSTCSEYAQQQVIVAQMGRDDADNVIYSSTYSAPVFPRAQPWARAYFDFQLHEKPDREHWRFAIVRYSPSTGGVYQLSTGGSS